MPAGALLVVTKVKSEVHIKFNITMKLMRSTEANECPPSLIVSITTEAKRGGSSIHMTFQTFSAVRAFFRRLFLSSHILILNLLLKTFIFTSAEFQQHASVCIIHRHS